MTEVAPAAPQPRGQEQEEEEEEAPSAADPGAQGPRPEVEEASKGPEGAAAAAMPRDPEEEHGAANGELPAIAEEDQVVTTYTVVPPDGGWGWVVAGAAFLSNLVVDGIIFSFGMYLTDMSEGLNESKPTVALIGSLLAGFYLIVGPFVSALANRYGFRLVAVLGSVVGSASFFASYFATSALYLCISYGIIGGVGFGLIYVPAVITVGFYFERWRALATGIAVCGSGIGTFVMPPIITALIGQFGWRGSLLVLAGLILNCAIFGLVYRPLKPQKVTIQNKVEEEEDDSPKEEFQNSPKPGEQLPLLVRIKMARDDQLHKSHSVASFADNVSVTAEKPPVQSRILKAHNNNTYPTAAEALAGSVVQLNGSKQVSCHSLNLVEGNIAGSNMSRVGSITLPKPQKRLSVPTYPDGYTAVPTEKPVDQNGTEATEMLLPVKEENHNTHYSVNEIPKEALQKRNSRTRTVSECSRSSCRSRKGMSTSKDNLGVRPLYRDDIFFGGSLQRLPQYTSQTSVGYHMSVSRLPTKADVEEEKKCVVCPEAVQRILATMLDLSLLRSPTFLLLSLSGSITMMGFYVPFMFIADRAEMNGMEKTLAVLLVSVIGIANTVGRVGCGILTSLPGVDSLLINNVALTVGGIATMFSGLDSSSAYQFTYASIFGLAMACFASLRSIIIVDLLGLDKLTNAFGLLLLFQGIAATIGSPLAGGFMEATGSYDASFYLSGGLILLSALLCYPLNRVNRWEKSRTRSKGDEIL